MSTDKYRLRNRGSKKRKEKAHKGERIYQPLNVVSTYEWINCSCGRMHQIGWSSTKINNPKIISHRPFSRPHHLKGAMFKCQGVAQVYINTRLWWPFWTEWEGKSEGESAKEREKWTPCSQGAIRVNIQAEPTALRLKRCDQCDTVDQWNSICLWKARIKWDIMGGMSCTVLFISGFILPISRR